MKISKSQKSKFKTCKFKTNSIPYPNSMEEKKSIALFINPVLSSRTKQIIADVTTVLSQRNICYELFNIFWPEDLHSYREAWIIGGDGTLNYFLNRYQDVSMPIAIFKGGTGNDFATKLYGSLTALQQAEYLLSAPVHPVDAGMCNDLVFINGLGVGFDGEVVRSMRSIRWLGSHLGYLFAVIKQVFFFREEDFRIVLDEKIIEDRFLLCLVCNSSQMGGGFQVSPASKTDDGFLDLILCNPMSFLRRLRYLPVIEKGLHLQLPFIRHFTFSRVNIGCSKNLYIQLDGELRSGKNFVITVMPKRYLFRY